MTELIKAIPKVGPVLGFAAGPIFNALTPAIADALTGLFGLGDDLLGPPQTFVMTPRDMIMTAEGVNQTERSVGFKFQSPLIHSGDGADYKIYFGASKAP